MTTPKSMLAELESIKQNNAECMRVIASKDSTMKEKTECRAKMLENNHQKKHIESVLCTIKYDPLF